MKYKIGDKVRIKSFKWYNRKKNENGNIYCGAYVMTQAMAIYCGKQAIITEVLKDGYRINLDRNRWCWTDEMFEEESIEILETILCAAIHYDNGLEYPHQHTYGIKTGFVLCGYRHPNIIGVLPTNVYFEKIDENSVKVAWDENCPKHETHQGFLTSTGRFVDRKEAAKIALASGQIEKLNYSDKELYSEDLY